MRTSTDQRNITWPMQPIGELLKQVRRPVDVDKDTTYREIGIRSHCKGIFHKPETTGKQIGTKRVFWIEPGCLTFNIIFAWEQAVAMTSEAEAGMIASHRFPMYCSRNGKLLPEYAWRYFSTPRGKYDLNIASPGGAGRNKTLGQEEFKRLKIPVPPVDYQRKVIEILATVDRAIDQTKKLIAAKRKLKKGLAQQLLTGKRRLPGFKKSWEQTNIGMIAQCAAGGTPSTRKAEYWGGDIPWAQSGDIHQGVIRSVSGRITETGLKNSSAKIFPVNTVLIALAGQGKTRGTSAITAIPLCTNQSIAGLICKKQHCRPSFLFHNLSSRYQELRSLSKGDGGRGGLTLGLIRFIKISLPPLAEQKRIAAILGATDQEVTLLEKKLNTFREQKKGLMQKLLTGKVRVLA